MQSDMTKENALYALWCENATEDADLTAELEAIRGDQDAIRERFYKDLEFGTGGLRGVLGAGTGRMNIYTVRRATQGLANYVKESFADPSVAISYDSRIKSDTFARTAAAVLAPAAAGIGLTAAPHSASSTRVSPWASLRGRTGP